MNKDARAFFFHYNKPASRAAGKPQISVHTKGRCFIVNNIRCEVPCRGRIKKRQSFFVMTGRGCLTILENPAMGVRTAVLKSRLKSWEPEA